MRRPALAEAEAERRLARDGRDVAALIAKGDHRYQAEDRRGAAAFYAAAIRMAQEGAPADGVELESAARRAQTIKDGILPHLVARPVRDGHPRGDWHPRFAEAVDILVGTRTRQPSAVRYPQMPTTYFHPGLPERDFFDPESFAWRETLEAATPEIRAEGLKLLRADGSFAPYVRKSTDRPQGDVHGMLENRDWTTYELTEMGHPMPGRVARCPRSYAAVAENVPLCDIPNRAPSVMFSLLAPGKRIPPHTGMINVRLICHLPLVVPGAGALRVGSTSRTWEEGRLLVFDDSVEHDARNDAEAARLVLIFDIWHPELEPIEREQIRALFDAVESY